MHGVRAAACYLWVLQTKISTDHLSSKNFGPRTHCHSGSGDGHLAVIRRRKLKVSDQGTEDGFHLDHRHRLPDARVRAREEGKGRICCVEVGWQVLPPRGLEFFGVGPPDLSQCVDHPDLQGVSFL